MRRFVIRNAQGARIGEGIEQANGEIVARLPLDWPGAQLGERSRWEDLDVAMFVIGGLELKLEWLTQEAIGARCKWDWEHNPDFWTNPQHGRPMPETRSESPHEAIAFLDD